MGKYRPLNVGDDTPLFVVRRDLSGGVNTRQNEQVLGENQSTVLSNVLIDTAGMRTIRTGLTELDATYPASAGTGLGLFGFEPDGGTNELLAVQLTNLSGWTGSGTFTNHKTDFTTGLRTTIIKAGMLTQNDIAIISNGTDNVFAMYQDHTMVDLGSTSGTGNDSPPKTLALAYYGNRLWALKSNNLYFSDAYPSSYSNTFDTATGFFRVPVGSERFVIGTRDQGLVIGGQDQIWKLNPSLTPDASTDKPEMVIPIGCSAGDTAVVVGDDIVFLAPDGVRGLFRTQLDKLQTGQSFPLSYSIKTEVDSINWGYIDKACAVWYDNKYIISLPTGASTYNNSVWIYYPAMNSWVTITGWNIARFAKLRISGKEKLFGSDSSTGQVYQLFYGSDDNGTPIAYTEESRAEDFSKPLQYKNGGEVKIKAEGGNGTLSVYASTDGSAYLLLGRLTLTITGVTFPCTFPVTLTEAYEANGNWHLDGLTKFKRIKFKIYTNDSTSLKILETIAVTFADEYESESTGTSSNYINDGYGAYGYGE